MLSWRQYLALYAIQFKDIYISVHAVVIYIRKITHEKQDHASLHFQNFQNKYFVNSLQIAVIKYLNQEMEFNIYNINDDELCYSALNEDKMIHLFTKCMQVYDTV